MDQKKLDLGVVSSESDQDGKKEICRKRCECIECLMLQRIWACKEKIFDKKRTKQTDQTMRYNLRHANPLWRDQRSANATLLDPRNQNKMKRRRAGVVHTHRDSLMTK